MSELRHAGRGDVVLLHESKLMCGYFGSASRLIQCASSSASLAATNHVTMAANGVQSVQPGSFGRKARRVTMRSRPSRPMNSEERILSLQPLGRSPRCRSPPNSVSRLCSWHRGGGNAASQQPLGQVAYHALTTLELGAQTGASHTPKGAGSFELDLDPRSRSAQHSSAFTNDQRT